MAAERIVNKYVTVYLIVGLSPASRLPGRAFFLCYDIKPMLLYQSVMSCPFIYPQRILRYPLLLRTILKLLDSASEEYQCLLGKLTVCLKWSFLEWTKAADKKRTDEGNQRVKQLYMISKDECALSLKTV